jgi:hypothetical protein
MDNTSFPSLVMDRLPSRSTCRDKILDWIKRHDAEFDPLETTPELLKLVELHKTPEKI